MNLLGKVAVITGAGSGIGEAIARRFAADGGMVMVSDVNEKAAKSVAGSLAGKAKAYGADVANEGEVSALGQHRYQHQLTTVDALPPLRRACATIMPTAYLVVPAEI